MAEIANRNWIYILILAKLAPSLNANQSGAVMAISTTLRQPKSASGLRLLFARMGSQLRRMIAMAGAPYVDGAMPL